MLDEGVFYVDDEIVTMVDILLQLAKMKKKDKWKLNRKERGRSSFYSVN